MADEKVIAAKVQIDTDAAQKNVLKLQGTVDDLRKAFKKAEAGSEEQLDALKKLTAAEQELAAAQTKLAESNEKSLGAFSKIKGSLKELPGAAGAAGQSVTGLSGTFKALLANPVVLVITAIVAALTFLAKAFASTKKGADLIAQGFAYLTGAVDKVVQIVGDFITGIKSAGDLISKVGNFLLHPIDSFKKLGKEVSDAAEATARLKREQQQLERDQINNLARNKDLIKQEEALKNIRDNEFNSIKDRIKANEEASALEKQRLATLEGLQLREVQRLQKLIALKGGEAKATNDQLKELREAELELADIREESIGRENEFLTNRYGLQKEAADKEKELRDKAAEAEKTRLENLNAFINKVNKLRQDNYLATVTDTYLKETLAVRNRIADEKKQNEQDYKDKKINLEQLNQLNEELEVQKQNELNALRKTDQDNRKAKEKEFEKELAEVATKTRLDAMKDARAKERAELEIGYQEKLQQAKDKYKDDAEKLAKYTAAIDEQYRTEKTAKEKGYKEEDDKKILATKTAAQEQIVNDQKATFDAQRAALAAEQALLDEAFKNKLISEEEYHTKTAEIKKKGEDIDKKVAEQRKARATEYADTLEKLSSLIGKKTVVGKGLGIAAALINTWQGASEALKQPSTLPSPFDVIAKVTNVATVVAAGLKTVKEIAKVQVPGGGGGGGDQGTTAPSISAPAAPIAPTQSSTSLDQNTINNIGNAAAGGVNGIRAYVVEEDSAAAAARAARLQGAAVLGG